MTERELISDYSPVEPDRLLVYPLAPEQTTGDDPPPTILTVDGVTAEWPIKGLGHSRDFEVEVEYVPDTLAVSAASFEYYLGTYKDARISQESMAQLVKRHLRGALETDDVFVEVKTDRKYVRSGSIDT